MAWIREKINLPKTLKPAERKVVAELVINHIINRSAAGLDKNDNKFPKYTKAYAEKKGVGVNDVDLILEGEMLESLQLLSHKAGEIVIGFDKEDSRLNGKAEGNILGSYGGEPNKKKARDFLGLSSDDLEVIIDSFDTDVELTEEEVRALTRELTDELLGDL